MNNIFNWQNDSNKFSISGALMGNGGFGGYKSKGNSLDLSNWNDAGNNHNNNSNNSITELLQNMISNGSIDVNSFSNMSNQQRRDSILKIINDQNALRSQRSSSDQSRNSNLNANLREDIFEKKKQQQQQQQQRQPPQINVQSTPTQQKQSPNIRKSPHQQQQQQQQLHSPNQQRSRTSQHQQSNSLNIPRDKDNVSPTSSANTSPRYQDEPQSPKASPVAYPNMRLNESFQTNIYQQQQSQQQQQQQQQRPLPQQGQGQQRVFQNYPVSPQNQYQYSAYPNYNPSLGYSNFSSQQHQQFPGNRNNSFGNYIYPVQTQQQPMPPQLQQQQYYAQQMVAPQQQQQFIPPAVTTKPQVGLAQQAQPQQQQPQQQQQQPQQQQQQQQQQLQQQPRQQLQPPMKSPQQKQQKAPAKRTRRPRKGSNTSSNSSAVSGKTLGSPSNPNLVPAQQFAQSEDGRPLLGATKVDQLMLVIQAREKGITNTIEQAPDGSILASPENFGLGRSKAELDSGILPRPVSLVGGVDKPHKKDDEETEVDGSHHHKRRKTRINNVLIVSNILLNLPI